MEEQGRNMFNRKRGNKSLAPVVRHHGHVRGFSSYIPAVKPSFKEPQGLKSSKSEDSVCNLVRRNETNETKAIDENDVALQYNCIL